MRARKPVFLKTRIIFWSLYGRALLPKIGIGGANANNYLSFSLHERNEEGKKLVSNGKTLFWTCCFWIVQAAASIWWFILQGDLFLAIFLAWVLAESTLLLMQHDSFHDKYANLFIEHSYGDWVRDKKPTPAEERALVEEWIREPLLRPNALIILAALIDSILRSVLGFTYRNIAGALSFLWRGKFIPEDVKLLASLDRQNGELSLSKSDGKITESK